MHKLRYLLIYSLLATLIGCVEHKGSSLQDDKAGAAEATGQTGATTCEALATRSALKSAIDSVEFSKVDLVANYIRFEAFNEVQGKTNDKTFVARLTSSGPSVPVQTNLRVLTDGKLSGCKIKKVEQLSIAEADRLFGPSEDFYQSKDADDKQSIN